MLKMLVVDDQKAERKGIKFLVKYKNSDESIQGHLQDTDKEIFPTYICMLQVACSKPFFDQNHDFFTTILKESIKWDYEYANVNEHQGLVFIKTKLRLDDKAALLRVGEKLRSLILESAQIQAFILINDSVDQRDALREQYNEAESLMETLFFYNQGLVIFAGEEASYASGNEQNVSLFLETIYRLIERKDYQELTQQIEFIFSYFKTEGYKQASIIHVKYTCLEIVRRLYTTLSFETKHKNQLKGYLDNIYKGATLEELKNVVCGMLSEMELPHSFKADDFNRKAILSVMKIIDEEYMQDISVEQLANRVYLSPDYLSKLFKEETGTGLIKYVTNFRLNKAKALLNISNLKIIEISRNVGYTNVSYFCALFKHHYGISAVKYREKGG